MPAEIGDSSLVADVSVPEVMPACCGEGAVSRHSGDVDESQLSLLHWQQHLAWSGVEHHGLWHRDQPFTVGGQGRGPDKDSISSNGDHQCCGPGQQGKWGSVGRVVGERGHVLAEACASPEL